MPKRNSAVSFPLKPATQLHHFILGAMAVALLLTALLNSVWWVNVVAMGAVLLGAVLQVLSWRKLQRVTQLRIVDQNVSIVLSDGGPKKSEAAAVASPIQIHSLFITRFLVILRFSFVDGKALFSYSLPLTAQSFYTRNDFRHFRSLLKTFPLNPANTD